jgi:hypothetical protein
MAGGCVRYLFDKGMQVLLFLHRQDGALTLAGYPFARTAEDVPSDAPWVKAVRLYVEIAALPKGERRRALIAHRDQFRAAPSDPDSKLLADDIDRQIDPQIVPPND